MLQDAYQILIKYWPLFWYGIKTTLLISLTGTLIGLGIGLIVGGLRAIPVEKRDSPLKKIINSVIYFITTVYIEVFRGTPMIVQAIFLYYGLKNIFFWTPTVAGIFIVSINTGAYMAEIIRAGIQSVDKGQIEAARSIGMNQMQTMFYVVLPQAIKNSFPSMGNEFVVNIKDTSVLNVISVSELFFQSYKIAGSIFSYANTMLVAAVIYLVLTFTTTRILHFIEHRLNKTKSSYPASQTVPHANVVHKKVRKS